MVVIALAAALTSWAVTALAGVHLGAVRAAQAGLNAAVPALVILGVGLAGYGFMPRRAVALGYGLAAWSFLIQMVGSTVNAPAWLLDLSLVHHMAMAPAVAPNWSADAVMMLAAVCAAAVGSAAFARRDLVAA